MSQWGASEWPILWVGDPPPFQVNVDDSCTVAENVQVALVTQVSVSDSISANEKAYKYRSLTIDHTQVPSDQTNFPVLVHLSDATLKDAAHGGHVLNADGSDILFFSDTTASTQLASEIDFYDNINGVLWAWVEVPTVSSSADTIVYVTYGAVLQARATNPWDSDYAFVLHLPDGTTLTQTDSTGNLAFTQSGSPTAATGNIDGAATFGSGNRLSGAHSTVLDSTRITLSAWVKGTSLGSVPSIIDRDNASTDRVYQFRSDGVHLEFIAFTTAGLGDLVGGTAINDGAWHYVVGTYDGANLQVYVDGNSDATPQGRSGNLDVSTTLSVSVGGSVNNSTYWNGQIDEARQSKIARSADWTKTEYNNQKPSSTFITVGAEVSVSFVFLNLSSFPIVESVTTTESVTVQISAPLISISDSASASERSTLVEVDAVSVNDSTSVTENSSVAEIDPLETVSVNDATSTSENSAVVIEVPSYDLIVVDVIFVSDGVALVEMDSLLTLSVYDACAISESEAVVPAGLTIDGCTVAEHVLVVIVGGALTLLCPVVANHLQTGVPTSFFIPAFGGTPPYTWTIVGGALPPGLTLNVSTGEVSGIPTSAGKYSFQVSITDFLGVVVYSSCGGGLGPSGGTGIGLCVDRRILGTDAEHPSVNSFETSGTPPSGTTYVAGRDGVRPGLTGRGVRPNTIGSFAFGEIPWTGVAFYFPDLQPQFGLESKYLFDTMGGAISIDYGMRAQLLTDGRVRLTFSTWLPATSPSTLFSVLKGFAATPACWYFMEFYCLTHSSYIDNGDGTSQVTFSIDWEVWINDYNGPNGPYPVAFAPWFGSASWTALRAPNTDTRGVLKGGPYLGDNSCIIDDAYGALARLGDGIADDYSDPAHPAWVTASCAEPRVTQVLYEVGIEEVAIPQVTEVLYEVGLQEVSVPQVTQVLYEVGLAEHANSFPEYIKRRNAPGNG